MYSTIPVAARTQNSRKASAPRWRKGFAGTPNARSSSRSTATNADSARGNGAVATSGSAAKEEATFFNRKVDDERGAGLELERLLAHVVEVSLGAVAHPRHDAMPARGHREPAVERRV